MHIGNAARNRTVEMFRSLINEYRHQIEEAYCREDKELSISFPVKFSPGKRGGTDIEVNINFVAERVKARTKSNVDANQRVFDFEEKRINRNQKRKRLSRNTPGVKCYMRSRKGLK